MELAQAFHLPRIVVMDEFSDKQTQFLDEPLFSVFEKSILRANLKTQVVESYHLVVTHNMDVERGFSITKATESANQSQISAKLYDSLRFVHNRFDHQQYETYDPPEALLCKIKTAGTEYKLSLIHI